MLQQLRRLCANELSSREEQGVIEWHHEHFRRRAERLDPSFFPGLEKNPDSIESHGGGAYTWFKSGDFRDGVGAFQVAVDKPHDPPMGFLYYWRGSATVAYFLVEATSGRIAFRRRRQRNLRLALQNGFHSSTSGVETRWSLPEWSAHGPSVAPAAVPLTQLQVDASKLRGTALVRAILEAAGRPLTHAEIAAVDEQSLGLADERVSSEAEWDPADPQVADAEREALSGDLAARLRDLYARLDEPTRRVLVARRFAEPDVPTPSFRTIAPWVGKGHETCRKLEAFFRMSFQRWVDRDEIEPAVAILVELVRTDPLTREWEEASGRDEDQP